MPPGRRKERKHESNIRKTAEIYGQRSGASACHGAVWLGCRDTGAGKSLEKTAKTIGILSSEYFSTLVNPEVKELLEELKGAEDLTEVQKAVVEKDGGRCQKSGGHSAGRISGIQ